MQLSAPHGSIVILSGSRLFWNVCEAQWATESTFTLTHTGNIINLAAAGVGATLTHIWYSRAKRHTTTSTDEQSLPLGWARFSPPLSRTHRAPGWRTGASSVSHHPPMPRSRFLGMAALSSWLDWSSLCAESKLLVRRCLVLPEMYIVQSQKKLILLTNTSKGFICTTQTQIKQFSKILKKVEVEILFPEEAQFRFSTMLNTKLCIKFKTDFT